MAKLQLGFHGNQAGFNKADLLKIVSVSSEESGLERSEANLMLKTGLGNKKVTPFKSWATRAGFITGSHLSSQGKIIVANDIYLNSLLTNWYIHFYFSLGSSGLAAPPTDPAEWGGWTWFVYSFLPEHFSFTTENLVYEAIQVFDNEPKLEKNFRYVLRAYTDAEALESCQFLQKLSDNKYIAGEARLPNPYMVGFFLAKLWERDFGETDSVVTDDILNHKMGLAPLLGLEPTTLQTQLDKLEIFGLIEQRRTVPPFQTVRRWQTPLTLLEQAYAYVE
jgi:hypothetical protein